MEVNQAFSGQNYSAFYYGVELDGRINYDKVEEIAKTSSYQKLLFVVQVHMLERLTLKDLEK